GVLGLVAFLWAFWRDPVPRPAVPPAPKAPRGPAPPRSHKGLILAGLILALIALLALMSRPRPDRAAVLLLGAGLLLAACAWLKARGARLVPAGRRPRLLIGCGCLLLLALPAVAFLGMATVSRPATSRRAVDMPHGFGALVVVAPDAKSQV